MRTYSKLALAVAATLAGGSSAYALNVDQTAAAPVTLVVAGASAYRDTFALQMPSICTGTVDQFRAVGSPTPDLRVYSCAANTASGIVAGTGIAVYYRSEGGSVYGVGPLAKGIQIDRLVVSSPGCVASGTSTHQFNCSVTGWSITADTSTSGTTNAPVQLGVSDVEPAQFGQGINWPDGTVMGGLPSAGEIGNIDGIISGNAVTFGVYVNAGLGINALSKQSITSIFNGTYTNWNAVPRPDNSGFVSAVSLPINVCRREFGSGTHATANIFFLNSCSSATTGFVATGTVYASGGALASCVANIAGSIGYSSLIATTSTTLVSINEGPVPTKYAAAQGDYDYWFENTFNYRTDTLIPASNADLVAQALILASQQQATIPATSANTFALPLGGNSIAVPVVGTGTPVGIGYRTGNSCALPIGAN